MFKTQNGWTKETMKARIRERNNGYVSFHDGVCRYRAPDGNQCAAGCFIEDEDYNALMEGVSVRNHPLFNKVKFPLDLNGMSLLQAVHDRHDNRGDVRDALFNWIDENVEDAA